MTNSRGTRATRSAFLLTVRRIVGSNPGFGNHNVKCLIIFIPHSHHIHRLAEVQRFRHGESPVQLPEVRHQNLSSSSTRPCESYRCITNSSSPNIPVRNGFMRGFKKNQLEELRFDNMYNCVCDCMCNRPALK